MDNNGLMYIFPLTCFSLQRQKGMNGSYCYVALQETIKSTIRTYDAGVRNEREQQLVLFYYMFLHIPLFSVTDLCVRNLLSSFLVLIYHGSIHGCKEEEKQCKRCLTLMPTTTTRGASHLHKRDSTTDLW
jgi:hypothetical protein